MRRLLSLAVVALLVACNTVLDIPEATLRGDDTPDDDDSTQCESGQKACNGQCVTSRNPNTGCGREGCRSCNLANATATCDDNGDCAIADCNDGFGDCNGDPSDGCESELQSDRSNCSTCGHQCNGGLQCNEGSCVCTNDDDCNFGGCSVDQGLCYCSSSEPCSAGSNCTRPDTCAF